MSYCDVRLGCHSALALRQDEPLLSQSQGLRVCSSSCDPFGRPSSLYCAVQTMHYTLQPHTSGAFLSITGSFIQLFKQNSRTERKVSHHCGVAMSQRIMLDLKQVMSISSSWSLWFLSLSREVFLLDEIFRNFKNRTHTEFNVLEPCN